MKPVSQGTLNVRFERIQGSPLGPFRMHFCSFPGFVILLKLRSRVGGSAFLRVWVGPGLVFLHTGRLYKNYSAQNVHNDLPPPSCEFYGPGAASHH